MVSCLVLRPHYGVSCGGKRVREEQMVVADGGVWQGRPLGSGMYLVVVDRAERGGRVYYSPDPAGIVLCIVSCVCL